MASSGSSSYFSQKVSITSEGFGVSTSMSLVSNRSRSVMLSSMMPRQIASSSRIPKISSRDSASSFVCSPSFSSKWKETDGSTLRISKSLFAAYPASSLPISFRRIPYRTSFLTASSLLHSVCSIIFPLPSLKSLLLYQRLQNPPASKFASNPDPLALVSFYHKYPNDMRLSSRMPSFPVSLLLFY